MHTEANTFEQVVRSKNPSMSEEDVKECIEFLKTAIPRVSKKIMMERIREDSAKRIENEIDQLMRNLSLAGYFEIVPRVKISYTSLNGYFKKINFNYY